MEKTRIGIVGYGNLGRGVEASITQNEDLELVAAVSRRKDIEVITPNIPVYTVHEAKNLVGKVDVLMLCGGSATDLPVQSPLFAENFCIVDSFDNHSKINHHFKKVDEVAKKHNTTAVISVGWDPGMFSVNRLYSNCILPKGQNYTFWGKGISQGHSDAIRRVEGVADARQYTVPVDDAMEAVRSGKNPSLTTRDKHLRDCYVVAKEGYDKEKIKQEIINMPAYFADYNTTVTFITHEELKEKHSGMPHGGFVIRSGDTQNAKHIVEYSIKLDSNPEFTASVMTAYARAAHKLYKEGKYGCFTAFDIPPAMLSPKTPEEMRAEML